MDRNDAFGLIVQIAERAEQMERANGMPTTNRMTRVMDLDFAHRDTPMDLDALLTANDFTFAHDVFGIGRHMDRIAKTLSGGFVPRTALHTVAQ